MIALLLMLVLFLIASPALAIVLGGALVAGGLWLSTRLASAIALGRAASVNSVSIFIAVMLGGWMWGPIGLILAVPVLMIIKTVADHIESLSSLSQLLGDRR